MKFNLPSLTVLALFGAAACLPAHAESLASSASSAGSASLASVSDSFQGSSNSSTKTNVAAGDYRIDAVTEPADRPGMVRLALQHTERSGDDSAFALLLPKRTFEQQGLARGDVVAARSRPYGYEFARADTRQAFFLVLADAWLRELDPQPVTTQRL